MILAVAIVVSVVIALLEGGEFSALADVPLRYGGLAVAAFAVQVFFIYQTPSQIGVGVWHWHALLLVGSCLLLMATVWVNRHSRGVKLIGLGLLLNLIVMVANGGWMPVTPEAVIRAGHTDLVPSLASGMRIYSSKDIILLREETRLWVLSDVLVVPRPFPVPSVFSIGDVLVALGTFVFIRSGMLWHGCSGTNSAQRSE
ncbi:MAG TPA: DUF5317 domain-containing protein [Anaerolineae bacterium]|nr:DUF5317 domain-containing protein [Anaerolineae bacterium]